MISTSKRIARLKEIIAHEGCIGWSPDKDCRVCCFNTNTGDFNRPDCELQSGEADGHFGIAKRTLKKIKIDLIKEILQ